MTGMETTDKAVQMDLTNVCHECGAKIGGTLYLVLHHEAEFCSKECRERYLARVGY
jgi:hypothetical protein